MKAFHTPKGMIQLAIFYWDPSPELFKLPLVHWPILWYGVLFALGFALGFPVFSGILVRFFLQKPDFEEREILQKKGGSAKSLNERLAGDEPIEAPLAKREAYFAFCSLHPQRALRRLKLEALSPQGLLSLRR